MEGKQHPDIEQLRRMRILAQFGDEQLQKLADKLEVETVANKTRLMERGCSDNYSLYLLQGSLITIAPDGIKKTIVSSDDGDLPPIAQIRPSMYDVIASQTAQIVKIYIDQLTEFAQQIEVTEVQMDVITIEQSDEENALTVQLFQDIMSGNLTLPSLPDVALRIQQEFSSDTADAQSISEIIQSDPAITAKLIMIANSALYGGQVQIQTPQQAVVRLGLETTRKQVMIYAVKELFREKSSAMKSRMQNLWKHSQQVASLSRLLAQQLKCFDPEQAQLAGLIHDLGEVAILHYAQQQEKLCDDPDKLLVAIKKLRSQITGMLLNQWNFSADYVTVGEESEDWFRNPGDEPDLCDLVLIAQYHSFIGTPSMRELPPISKLPAFAKLGMAELKTSDILEFMKQSREQIEAIESHLGAI